jgi:hypothetical protein
MCLYKAAICESLEIVSQFRFMTVEDEGTNLKAAANRGKVIRASVNPEMF